MVLSGTSGILLNVIPNGTSSVMSISNLGDITCNSINGVGGSSTLGDTTTSKLTTQELVSNTKTDLSGSSLVLSHDVVQIVSANIGSSATNPLDISNKQIVMLDGSNGGTQLVAPASDATIKLDTTNVVTGQIIEFRLLKKNNTNKLKMLNGDATAPLFAKIDFASGYQDIAYTVYPEFDDTFNGDVFLKCQWVETSAGQFRLVILESSGMLNV